MWVCGLKLSPAGLAAAPVAVTPYVGVWIETVTSFSLPSSCSVTPYVGVWIETVCDIPFVMVHPVTPYVGVWIETYEKAIEAAKKASHPMWVCGLKL